MARLPFDPPDDVSVERFMLDEDYGRRSLTESRPPFVCGLTGKSYTAVEVKDRVDALARGLSKELCFEVNDGTEYDKVVGVYSVNTVSGLFKAIINVKLIHDRSIP